VLAHEKSYAPVAGPLVIIPDSLYEVDPGQFDGKRR